MLPRIITIVSAFALIANVGAYVSDDELDKLDALLRRAYEYDDDWSSLGARDLDLFEESLYYPEVTRRDPTSAAAPPAAAATPSAMPPGTPQAGATRNDGGAAPEVGPQSRTFGSGINFVGAGGSSAGKFRINGEYLTAEEAREKLRETNIINTGVEKPRRPPPTVSDQAIRTGPRMENNFGAMFFEGGKNTVGGIITTEKDGHRSAGGGRMVNNFRGQMTVTGGSNSVGQITQLPGESINFVHDDSRRASHSQGSSTPSTPSTLSPPPSPGGDTPSASSLKPQNGKTPFSPHSKRDVTSSGGVRLVRRGPGSSGTGAPVPTSAAAVATPKATPSRSSRQYTPDSDSSDDDSRWDDSRWDHPDNAPNVYGAMVANNKGRITHNQYGDPPTPRQNPGRPDIHGVWVNDNSGSVTMNSFPAPAASNPHRPGNQAPGSPGAPAAQAQQLGGESSGAGAAAASKHDDAIYSQSARRVNPVGNSRFGSHTTMTMTGDPTTGFEQWEQVDGVYVSPDKLIHVKVTKDQGTHVKTTTYYEGTPPKPDRTSQVTTLPNGRTKTHSVPHRPGLLETLKPV